MATYTANVTGAIFDELDKIRRQNEGEKATVALARLTPAKRKRLYKLGNYLARAATGQKGKTGEYKQACKR